MAAVFSSLPSSGVSLLAPAAPPLLESHDLTFFADSLSAEEMREFELKEAAEKTKHPEVLKPKPGFFRKCVNFVAATKLGRAAAQAAASPAVQHATYLGGGLFKTTAFLVSGTASKAAIASKWASVQLSGGVSHCALLAAAYNVGVKKCEHRDNLKKLLGKEGLALADAVEAAIPAITRGIIYSLEKTAANQRKAKAMASKSDDQNCKVVLDAVNFFLSCGHSNVQKIIDSALLRAVSNIMWETHDANNPNEPPLMRILNWLSRNAEPGLVEEISKICQSGLGEDPEYYAYVALFTDTKTQDKLATKILNLAFPKGDFGLVAGANLTLWKVLKRYLPDILATVVQYYMFIKSPRAKEAGRREREEKVQREKKIQREELDQIESGHLPGVKKEHDQTVTELSRILYDREPFIRRMRASDLPPTDVESAIKARRAQEGNDEGCLALWRENGVTDKVRHLEIVSDIASKGIIQISKEFLGKESNGAFLLEILHTHFGISPIFNNWLGEQLKLLVESEDPLAKLIWENLGDCTSRALFNITANVIAKVVGDVRPEEHRESGIVYRALAHLAKLFKDHGSTAGFSALANELVAFTDNPENHRHPLHALPVPLSFRDLLWDSLKTQLLPKVVFPYLQQRFAQRDIKSLADELDMIFDHQPGAVSGVTTACQVVGQFVAEFTPHYISKENETVAEMLMELDLVKAGLVRLNLPEKQHLKAFIKKMLVEIGTSQDPNFQHLFKEAGHYSQALTMTIFGQASKKIQLIEYHQPKFLVKTVISVLAAVGEHFKLLLEVTKRSNKMHAYEVPIGQMFEGLRLNRHPDVRIDPNLSEEERIKIKMDDFYVKFTGKLLKFAEINNAADLSLPAPLFELLKTVKGPELLRTMIEKMMDKHTLNKLMLETLEPLNEAVEDLASRDAEGLRKEAEEDDAEQRELNKACGIAVQALVKMLPVNITKVFFKLKVVQDLSAEVIGKSVMKKIASTTILELINNFCERMFSEKIPIEAEPVTELEKIKTEKELKRVGVKLASQKIDEITRNFFSVQWASFQKWLDDLFISLFGPKGPIVKEILDIIFGFIFFRILGTVLSFIWENTLYLLFNFIIKAYLTAQADGVLKSMHLDAHKSAVFNILDSVLDDLAKTANSTTEEACEEHTLELLQTALDNALRGFSPPDKLQSSVA